MKTLAELLEFVKADQRVCPVPQMWGELYKSISTSRRSVNVPPPLILAAWWHTSDASKRERLALHLKCAEDAGLLVEVSAFLIDLKRDEWSYEGDAS